MNEKDDTKIPEFRPHDDRPGKGLWHPGEYFRMCNQCRNMFVGDKRAHHCASCEYGDDTCTTE